MTIHLELMKTLFTNATIEQYPLLNLTDAIHKFEESEIKGPKNDSDYKFVNSSIDYINMIKKIAEDEESVDYNNIEEISLRNVVITDEFSRIKKKILIRELIVLNSPDDDPDDATIVVNKAVIVPSISQDNTLERIKQKMYARATKKYNSKLDELMKMLNNLNSQQTGSPIQHQKNIHHLKQAKDTLGKLKIPVLKRKHTLEVINGEMQHFRKKVSKHVEMSLDLSDVDSERKQLKKMRRNLAKMKSKMVGLKKDLTSDEFEHTNQKDLKIKMQMIELSKEMEKLNKKMKELTEESEVRDEKVQEHHRKIRKIMYEHNKKIDDTINDDDFTEDDFVSAKNSNKNEEKESDLKTLGFKLSNINTKQ